MVSEDKSVLSSGFGGYGKTALQKLIFQFKSDFFPLSKKGIVGSHFLLLFGGQNGKLEDLEDTMLRSS
jgi:hypothetical protein